MLIVHFGEQHGEAGCGDVPRCDDPPPGPMAGQQHGEAGCGDVPCCDDPPPGPMAGQQHGEAGCGDVPLCDDPPPGPMAADRAASIWRGHDLDFVLSELDVWIVWSSQAHRPPLWNCVVCRPPPRKCHSILGAK